jgi:hypothetical protein
MKSKYHLVFLSLKLIKAVKIEKKRPLNIQDHLKLVRIRNFFAF